MNLIGKKVVHLKYGPGTVTAQDNASVTVKFYSNTQRYTYPNDIFDKVISFKDDSVWTEIIEEIRNVKSVKSTNKILRVEAQSRVEKIKTIYNEAWAYLKKIAPPEVQGEELQKYFTPHSYDNFRDITKVMFSNLQQRNQSTSVIGFDRAEKKEKFRQSLLDYDHKAILKTYKQDELFKTFRKFFPIKNAESNHNLWRIYAKSILSYCTFISEFKTVDEFDQYIRSFRNNEIELPNRLEKELFGCGFALSCNFLKDIGYVNYPKPDTHLKDIFPAFGFCEINYNMGIFERNVFHAAREMAKVVGDTPFVVDRLFWLIGSGDFYDHNIRIGSHKQKFISEMRKKGL